MTARADKELANLADRLRELADFAAAGRAAPEFIETTVAELLAALLELTEYRSGDRDPRRRRTLEISEKIRRARAAGASVDELAGRYRRSKSQINRILNSGARHHASVSVFTQRQSTGGTK